MGFDFCRAQQVIKLTTIPQQPVIRPHDLRAIAVDGIAAAHQLIRPLLANPSDEQISAVDSLYY
jgi:hypothetical protein